MRLDFLGPFVQSRAENEVQRGASVISPASIEVMPFSESAQGAVLCVKRFTTPARAFALWVAKLKASACHRLDIVNLGAF